MKKKKKTLLSINDVLSLDLTPLVPTIGLNAEPREYSVPTIDGLRDSHLSGALLSLLALSPYSSSHYSKEVLASRCGYVECRLLPA